jgi:hypothetical protein
MNIKKKCSSCGEVKQISLFKQDKRTKDGYGSQCKQCHSEANCQLNKKNYGRDREKNKERYKCWCHSDSGKKWRENNKYRRKNVWRKYSLKQKKDPGWVLQRRISIAIRTSIRLSKAGRKWETLVGYTVEELKQHLEKQFVRGMTWERMELWHIDHIIPISAFNFGKPEDIDFQRYWALRNLRPLWAKENHIKHARLSEPFQPSLLL